VRVSLGISECPYSKAHVSPLPKEWLTLAFAGAQKRNVLHRKPVINQSKNQAIQNSWLIPTFQEMDVFMPTYTGTNRSETIIASDGSDSIYGLDGNDRLITLDGSDFADAGNGDDEINAFFSAADSGFLVYPNRGSKRLLGGNGNDTIHGSKDPDTILGEMGNDNLAGDTADDSIYGGEGDDTINGNSE